MKPITTRSGSIAANACCSRRCASAATDELIVTDGFSCREMIRQETERRALHFAEVLQMALHEGPDGPRDGLPEARYTKVERTAALPLTIVAAGLAAVAGVWYATRTA